MITAKGFDVTARYNARAAGLPDLMIIALPDSVMPPMKVIEETKFGDKIAEQVVEALTLKALNFTGTAETINRIKETIGFIGKDYADAAEKMERYFLEHCWSDGFPLVPPTREAVDKMLQGTELAGDHVVSRVEPSGGIASVEKIAINAVMAGCLPQYLPVIISAFEAITDPRFDLRGIQCTAGCVSPLLIISGPKVIDQLNINDGYSTIGPGWRANSTIGRAIRLILINIGQSWPGKPDMKQLGSPFKFVPLMAENEEAYQGFWEPLRVAEGFAKNQATVSIMPAVSWNPYTVNPDIIDADKVIEYLSRAGRSKYDNNVGCWGMDDLVILTPSAFDAIRKERMSRAEMQKKLYALLQAPGNEFFEGRTASLSAAHALTYRVPDWIVKQYKENPESPVPLLRSPESLKIVVAGADGPSQVCYVGPWIKAHFVTKAIKIPANWDKLLEIYDGWQTPVLKPDKKN